MPKAFDKSHKITYPTGCKELSEELNTDELLKRLKSLSQAFQDMGQDENNKYKQIAFYLSTEFFMEHPSKDVRLLVACCIADIFRIFAPEAPYSEPGQLREIFLFLTEQLRGLQDPESPSFKRYFYLLENLAWVKSFNICIELEENMEIFCKLYQMMFSIVNENHAPKVVGYMLDMMCPMIREADVVSPDLLDILLLNIIEPHKSQNRCAYNLAKEVIKRTDSSLEPYIQNYFNTALMMGKNSESALSTRLYDLIYELNFISPSVLLAVLPQLEFKLKSNDVTDRKAVTRLLSKMFSAPESDLAIQNKQLWICYIGRFNDIDITVRRTCVQSSQEFIVNQPDLVKDISEPLKQRQHDPDENVRMDVVQAIVGAARRDFSAITDELLTCVKERTLDKKFKIRREALTGLGQIYRQNMQKEDTDKSTIEKIAWIKNKVLHAYYQSSLDDKVLVERILNNSLVPYSLDPEDKMQRLFHLYGTVDDHSILALHEIFKTQRQLRKMLRGLLELHQRGIEMTDPNMAHRVKAVARGLPDPVKSLEYIKKFNEIIHEDTRIRGYLIKLTSNDCPCKKAEECVKEVLKKMGNSITQNYLYGNVKVLMERVAPVMIDSHSISALMKFIKDAVDGDSELSDEVQKPIESGMKLLLMLARVFPGAFQTDDIFTRLLVFVKQDDDIVSDSTMEVFKFVGPRLEQDYPEIYLSLMPVLQKMVKIGTPKQAKHAIHCISALCKNKTTIFKQIFEHLQKNMDLDSPYFLSSLVAIGHITQMCPGEFGTTVKGIVARFIVKELLMQDRGQGRKSAESWIRDDLVSEETNAKLQAMKMMVRWLLGMGAEAASAAASTLRLLYTMVLHEGDLMEKGQVNKAEMARLRLQAGCCMIKLAQESQFSEKISLQQFQTIALLLNDPCYQVRCEFSQKLNKGLLNLRLPLQYMSIFCLAANDPHKERRIQVKHFLQSNINKRREYLKNNATMGRNVFALLPDYVLPYSIHLLAHDPELQSNNHVETLKHIKECLWFIMEPLITKSESYSYSFYKKIIENIKQTKDNQCPENVEANRKMYAVCDLALSLVMTKTANFVLKNFPADPVLPAKLFTQPDQNYSNNKNYLPKELQISKLNIPVKKPALSESVAASSSKPVTTLNGSPAVSDNEDSMSEASSTSPQINQSKQPAASGSKDISFGFNSPSVSPSQASGSRVRVIKVPASAAASLNKGAATSKSDDKTAGTTKDGQQKEDRPPAKGSRAATAAKKGQGKITDYVSPRPALANKDNKGVASQDSSPDSAKSSPDKEETGRRRGKRQNSAAASSPPPPTVRSTRKRASDESSDSGSNKRSKTNTGTKRTVRKPSTDPGTGSDSSPKSSPKKNTPADPPRKRGRPRTRKPSSESETIPSPSTPSSKSSTTSTTSPSPKRKSTVTATKTAVKKNYPIRSNLRRGSSNFQNGTSDGEDGTPESSSQSPQKTRTRGVRAADNKPEEKLNVKRRKMTRR